MVIAKEVHNLITSMEKALKRNQKMLKKKGWREKTFVQPDCASVERAESHQHRLEEWVVRPRWAEDVEADVRRHHLEQHGILQQQTAVGGANGHQGFTRPTHAAERCLVDTATFSTAACRAIATGPSSDAQRTSIKLPRYTGEASADTYLVQVQLAAQLNSWTSQETAVHVALSLEWRALQILTDLQPDELQDWVVLKAALQQCLGNAAVPGRDSTGAATGVDYMATSLTTAQLQPSSSPAPAPKNQQHSEQLN